MTTDSNCVSTAEVGGVRMVQLELDDNSEVEFVCALDDSVRIIVLKRRLFAQSSTVIWKFLDHARLHLESQIEQYLRACNGNKDVHDLAHEDQCNSVTYSPTNVV